MSQYLPIRFQTSAAGRFTSISRGIEVYVGFATTMLVEEGGAAGAWALAGTATHHASPIVTTVPPNLAFIVTSPSPRCGPCFRHGGAPRHRQQIAQGVATEPGQAHQDNGVRSMVISQIINVWSILQQCVAIVEIHPGHERLRFCGGVRGHAGHETTGGLEYWRTVVPDRGLDVRQPRCGLPDCREHVLGIPFYRPRRHRRTFSQS